MSGAVTYGPDSGANGAVEYAYLTTPQGRPQAVQYNPALGQVPPGMIMQHQQQPLVQQQVQQVTPLQHQQLQQQAQQQQHLAMQSAQHLQQQQHLAAAQQQQSAMAAAGMPMPSQQIQLVAHQGYQLAPRPMQGYQGGVPVQFYPTMAHQPGVPAFAHMGTTHVQDYRFGAPQFGVEQGWHGGAEWEEDYDENGGAVLYGTLEVKHRRRTTPEQLRVLEHWFSINPRPDNALREWLASELGITKRNVQVWFQNRRAKIKNQEKAREAAAADAKKEAERNGTSTASTSSAADGSGDAANAAGTSGSGPSGQIPPPILTQQANLLHATSLDPTGAVVTPTQPNHIGTPIQTPLVTTQVPSRPSSSGGNHDVGHDNVDIPTADKLNMGRRVSLAGGDISSIEAWARRRATLGQYGSGSVSVGNSPMGLAAAARRNSQPYPTQVLTAPVEGGENGSARSALPSPKVSPNGRMPQGLLVTAMRNNTLRRASMPGGGAQLISSNAFTPPRNASYVHPLPGSTQGLPTANGQPGRSGGPGRELSPIRDHDGELDPSLRGSVPATYVTGPSSTYANSMSGFLSVPEPDLGLSYTLNPGLPGVPFSPNSPLPNPTFSFGGAPSSGHSTPGGPGSLSISTDGVSMDKSDSQQQALFMALQRGRLGSIASVNSVNTTVTDGGTENGSELDWPSFMPQGFDPDIRRASAPADLLHNIGLLGISSANAGQHSLSAGASNATSGTATFARPSPLGSAAFSHSNLEAHNASLTSSTPTIPGGPYIPANDSSPITNGSAVPSEGPSPAGIHTQMHSTLMPPPPLPNRSQPVYAGYTDMGSAQYDFGVDSLPSSVPSLPDPSAYVFGSASSTSGSASGSSGDLGFLSSEADLGFDLRDDDKDQFAFLAELTSDLGSDGVNVLV